MWDRLLRFLSTVSLTPMEAGISIVISHNLWLGLTLVVIYWIFVEDDDESQP